MKRDSPTARQPDEVGNVHLGAARRNKRDEFYTQLRDIENEVRHYVDHFMGKVVYCNCDDPRISNFFHYFSYNFKRLGLKKLITTCYRNQDSNLFSLHDSEQAIKLEYDGLRDGDVTPRAEDIGIRQMIGDGDFRSPECIELLKQADIVVTNPPFSLFREYVAQLMEHDKKFLIVGNKNAISYKEVFPFIRDNKLWLGINPKGQDMLFDVAEDYAKELFATKKEGSAYRIVNGVAKARLGNAAWFTNLDFPQRHQDLVLYKKYSPDEYPAFDNYNAINVDRVVEIPEDYAGVMGVPITFLDKHNPDQFEILGITQSWFDARTKRYPKQIQVGKNGNRSEVTKLNDGASIKVSHPPTGSVHYFIGDDCYVKVFARLLIRNKNPDISI